MLGVIYNMWLLIKDENKNDYVLYKVLHLIYSVDIVFFYDVKKYERYRKVLENSTFMQIYCNSCGTSWPFFNKY